MSEAAQAREKSVALTATAQNTFGGSFNALSALKDLPHEDPEGGFRGGGIDVAQVTMVKS